MEILRQDLRYALRILLKQPAFTLVALITLALGIGANSAIFSVVHAVLLAPLPYAEPDQLMVLTQSHLQNKLTGQPVSWPNFNDWRQSQSFEEMALVRAVTFTLVEAGEAEQVSGVRVSTNLLRLLRVAPALGRDFAADEGVAGARPVVLVSHGLWQRRFGAKPELVGQPVTLDDVAYTVIGILPAGLKYPGLPYPATGADFWIPMLPQPNELVRGFHSNRVIGRLKPEVSLEQARAELNTIAVRLEKEYPNFNTSWRVEITPLHEQMVGRIRTALLVLLGAVGCVLLIACANVANLLLARAAGRRLEIAIRTALGATRRQLIRQLLTESVLLSFSGGVLGLLLATWSVPLLTGLSAGAIPRVEEITLNSWVLGFTLILSLVTGLIFGLMPAFQSSQASLTDSLKEGQKGGAGSGRAQRGLKFLVVSEVALALVLLVGAGLLLRSFLSVKQVAPGFQPAELLTLTIGLPATKYRDQAQQVAFYERLLPKLNVVPGVQSAAGVFRLPVIGFATANFTIQGRPVSFGNEPSADYRTVSFNYFRAMGIPLLAGRDLSEQDTVTAPDAVIINQALADRFWPGESAVGKYLQIATERTRWRPIVGVVGNVKHAGLDGPTDPCIYVPFPQNTWPHALRTTFLVVRSSLPPGTLLAAIRAEVQTIDASLALAQVRTMEEIIDNSLAARQFNLILLVSFAALAGVLAAVGIYGVMSYSVTQRTHELGLRLALGAQPADVRRMVLGAGAKLALLGVVIGLLGAFALTRLLTSLLYGVTATDPATFIGIALGVTGVALLASYLPARRATKVDPIIALRGE